MREAYPKFPINAASTASRLFIQVPANDSLRVADRTTENCVRHPSMGLLPHMWDVIEYAETGEINFEVHEDIANACTHRVLCSGYSIAQLKRFWD